jgi:NAD+ kinase
MKRIAIASRMDLEKHERIFKNTLRYLKKMGKEVYLEERVAKYMGLKKYNEFIPGKTKVDLVLVMGGDGTILRLVSQMKELDAKFFGINMGHLGFLSEIPPVRIEKILGRVFAGDYTIDKRMMIQADVARGGKIVGKYRALNEIAITQGTLSRLLVLKTKAGNRKLANYKSDGLIIATPTGSTAYSLAAGGPIIHPAIRAFIVTPICPHSFTHKPIVIPDTKGIEVLIASDYEMMILTADGQQSMTLKHQDVVHIKRDGFAEFIRLPNENYFLTLRQKLGWGGED